MSGERGGDEMKKKDREKNKQHTLGDAGYTGLLSMRRDRSIGSRCILGGSVVVE
jgi:hypothetical protein